MVGTQTVDLFAAGGRGSDLGNDFSEDEGADGRIMLGDDDTTDDSGNAGADTGSNSIRDIDGPRAINPFLHGSLGLGKTTPYIPNLIGGSQIYGFLDGITIDEINFNPQSKVARVAPDSDAVVAVMRLPGGLADIGLGDHPSAVDFDGFDWILVANVTDQNLPRPKVSIGVHSDSSTSATTLTPLAFDDLDPATDGPVTLNAFNAGQVWVTLIPNSRQTQTVRVNLSVAGDDFATATGEQVGNLINLKGAVLGTNGTDQVDFVTANIPALGSIGIGDG
ncbi:MAG: hypothetical protein MI861_17335, partial [Pirellulales bacterium]|nr:hypothetical protein [Pirellulales bacterium]